MTAAAVIAVCALAFSFVLGGYLNAGFYQKDCPENHAIAGFRLIAGNLQVGVNIFRQLEPARPPFRLRNVGLYIESNQWRPLDKSVSLLRNSENNFAIGYSAVNDRSVYPPTDPDATHLVIKRPTKALVHQIAFGFSVPIWLLLPFLVLWPLWRLVRSKDKRQRGFELIAPEGTETGGTETGT